MKPQYMPKNAAQRREYLVEELGELLSALGKSGRWGYTSTNPEIPVSKRITNAEWVKNEIADVRRALNLFEPDIDEQIKAQCLIAERQRALRR